MAPDSKPVLLVGAGGHAKTLRDSLEAGGYRIQAYVDPLPCTWLGEARHFTSDDIAIEALQSVANHMHVVLGLGGIDTAAIQRRLAVATRYNTVAMSLPALVSQTAYVSDSANIGAGAIVSHNAHIGADAAIGFGALINTKAIVEHDAVIGDGVHIAPGAIVLGGARVGDASFIGAGAVVLPGADLPAATFVKALAIAS